MSEPHNEGEPVVFTMPPSAYRVGDGTPQSARAYPIPEPAASAEQTSKARQRRAAPATGTVAAGGRGVRLADAIVTIVLIVAGAGAAGIGSVMALFLAFASDACSAPTCALQIEAGMWTAMLLPWVLWLGGVIWGIVRIVRRRLAFWVPLVAAAAGVAGWLLGAWIALATMG